MLFAGGGCGTERPLEHKHHQRIAGVRSNLVHKPAKDVQLQLLATGTLHETNIVNGKLPHDDGRVHRHEAVKHERRPQCV